VKVTNVIVMVGSMVLLAATALAQSSNQDQSLRQLYKIAKGLTPLDIPKLEKAAESGDIRKQVLLGTAYREGYAVSTDYSKAFHWLRKAADKGIGCCPGTTCAPV
jgi:TPR repeat protein